MMLNNTDKSFAPGALVKINGKKITQAGVDASELKVELILDGADSFSFVIHKALNNKLEVNYPKLLDFGDKVEIFFGYKDSFVSVITGIITSLSWSFDTSDYLDLTVEGYDYLFLMMKNEKYRSWNKKTDAEVIKEIVKKYPFKKLKIEDTPVMHPQIRQEGESDFSFLKRLAKRNGYEYFAEGEIFTFRPHGVNKPKTDKTKILSFVLGHNLLAFSPKVDISQQVSEVRVCGWNPNAKKEIIESARKEDIYSVERDGKTGAEKIKSILKEEIIHEVKMSVQNPKMAKSLATSLLFDISYQLVKSECKAIGIPDLRPGQTVQIEKAGDLFSRKYYVDRVTQQINSNGYETHFSVKGDTYNESY